MVWGMGRHECSVFFCSARLYMRFIDEIERLQVRICPHLAEYRRSIEKDEKVDVSIWLHCCVGVVITSSCGDDM